MAIYDWIIPGLIAGFVTLAGVILTGHLRERNKLRAEDLSLYKSVQTQVVKFPEPNDSTYDLRRDLTMLRDECFRTDLERGRFPSRLQSLKADIESFERLKDSALDAVEALYSGTNSVISVVVRKKHENEPGSTNVGNTNIKQAVIDSLRWPVFVGKKDLMHDEISSQGTDIKKRLEELLPSLYDEVVEYNDGEIPRLQKRYRQERTPFLKLASSIREEIKCCIEEEGRRTYRSAR